jgi:hypothetical protein
MTSKQGKTVKVLAPSGSNHSIDVKFFDNGGVRFRLNEAGPMLIKYVFLPGEGQNVIVELTPISPSPWVR